MREHSHHPFLSKGKEQEAAAQRLLLEEKLSALALTDEVSALNLVTLAVRRIFFMDAI